MLTSPHTPLHSPSSTYLRATAYDALGLLEPEYVRIFVEDVPVDGDGAAQRDAISEGAHDAGLSSGQREVVSRFLDGSFVQVVETSSAGAEALTALALRDLPTIMAAYYAARALVVSAALLSAGIVDGHRSMLSGTTVGPEFHTKDNALEVPWIDKSWAINRVTTCAEPAVWIKINIPSANFSLYLGAGVPRLARFAAVSAGNSSFSGTTLRSRPLKIQCARSPRLNTSPRTS